MAYVKFSEWFSFHNRAFPLISSFQRRISSASHSGSSHNIVRNVYWHNTKSSNEETCQSRYNFLLPHSTTSTRSLMKLSEKKIKINRSINNCRIASEMIVNECALGIWTKLSLEKEKFLSVSGFQSNWRVTIENHVECLINNHFHS